MEVSDDVESRRAASGLGPVSGDELKRRLTPNLQKKNFFINRPSFPDQFLQMTELKSDVINMDHVDKNDISVFNYETNNDKEGEILYHGLPFENVKSILQNGYEAPNIFGKTDVNKIFSYMLSKDNKVNEYGAIFKLKLIGVREITNNFADNSVLVSNCYLEAIYKVKLLDSQSDAPLPLRRQSGSSELRPKLLDTGDEPLHIFGGHRNKSKKRGKSKKRNSKKRRKNGQKNGQKSGRKNGRKNGQKSRRKSRRK